MLKVKQIKPEDTYSIRHKVLRPNQTISACRYDADQDYHSIHLGAFQNESLISVASFYKEKNNHFDEHLQYRLRGMATLEEYRGQGAGSSLIVYAESLLNKKFVKLWWCNARISVSDYYKNLGLDEHGDVFDIHPIGPHKLMYKKMS